MLVNNFCRNAISSKNAHFCWMMGRCYPFVETWGSIISKQSNVNQDHSVHEGLYVKVCWGCLKVMLSSALLASFFNENSTPFIPSKRTATGREIEQICYSPNVYYCCVNLTVGCRFNFHSADRYKASRL